MDNWQIFKNVSKMSDKPTGREGYARCACCGRDAKLIEYYTDDPRIFRSELKCVCNPKRQGDRK